MLVHVDDFAVTYSSRALYDKVFGKMKERFIIADYGGEPISRFVGICVERDVGDGSYKLHQKPYIEELLDRLGLRGESHAQSPERGGTKAKLGPGQGEPSEAEKEFMLSVP